MQARDLASRTWRPSGRLLPVATLDGRHLWRMHDPGGRIAQRLRTGRPYEFKLLEQIRTETTPGGVALDIGAHVGNHTLFLAFACGLHVHAFEPLPYNLQRLHANLELNPKVAGRITVWPYAAGDATGTADWRAGRYLSLDPNLPGDVPVRSVDDCLPGIVGVQVVKIDVEGFESRALVGMRGLLVRNRPVLWTEAHTDDALAAQEHALEGTGYQFDRMLHLGSRMARWRPA